MGGGQSLSFSCKKYRREIVKKGDNGAACGVKVKDMEEKFGQSSVLDVNKLVEANREKWISFSLTQVNDCIVRLGIFDGETGGLAGEKYEDMS